MYLKYFFFTSSSSRVNDWLEDIRPVDTWAEVTSSADVSVRVMDKVIWLPASRDQVFLGGGLFHSINGDTFDGTDSNEGKEFKHV